MIELQLNNFSSHTLESALLESMLAELHSCVLKLLAIQPPLGVAESLHTVECVEIALCNDCRMAELHLEFLGDPSPTDVITFPPLSGVACIAIGVDAAFRYAQEHGESFHRELFRYIVHGLAHLHGYNDETPADRESMFAIQESLVLDF